MSVKQLSAAVVAIALGTCTFTSQASNYAGPNWGPNQPDNQYRQAPNWPDYSAQRPAASAPPPAYRPRSPAPGANRTAPPPPTGPYSGTRATRSAPVPGPGPGSNRGAPAPQPGQYRGAPVPRGQYNQPSAFNTPGYNPNRYNRRGNNRWNRNKFWGRSGPSTWMSPGKRNWENSWDDMINTPSRMGEMPGGWTAPEVTVPNPIDMGDQMQDNVQDLPDQMRDGNIGNDVSN